VAGASLLACRAAARCDRAPPSRRRLTVSPPPLLFRADSTQRAGNKKFLRNQLEKLKTLKDVVKTHEAALAAAAARERELAARCDASDGHCRLLEGDARALARCSGRSELDDLHATLLTSLERVAAQQRRVHDDVVKERQCVICMERGATVLLRPCHHLCLCRVCATQLMTTAQQGAAGVAGALATCPKCRDQIHDTINVFQ
jgi:hypothetical protein